MQLQKLTLTGHSMKWQWQELHCFRSGLVPVLMYWLSLCFLLPLSFPLSFLLVKLLFVLLTGSHHLGPFPGSRTLADQRKLWRLLLGYLMGFLCSMKEPFDTGKSNWVFFICHFGTTWIHRGNYQKFPWKKNWFEIKEEIATSYLAWKSLNVV